MKKALVVLVALAFLAGSSLAAVAAMGPTEVKLPAKMMGTVTFPHAKHRKLVKDCKTCHHKGVAAGACRSCQTATRPPSSRSSPTSSAKAATRKKTAPPAATTATRSSRQADIVP